MNNYQKSKEKARQLAIVHQIQMGNKCLSYYELMAMCDTLRTLGKRYGLLKEFKENGVL